jgi:hypothetical protein
VRAFENGARLNPFVVALNWNLSRSHKKRDICDDLAEGGPYPLDNLPTMPAHPQDMCYWSNVLVENPAAVFADLGVAT